MNESNDAKYDPARLRSDKKVPMGEPWRPILTEKEKQEQEEYIKLHRLPF